MFNGPDKMRNASDAHWSRNVPITDPKTSEMQMAEAMLEALLDDGIDQDTRS